MTALDYRGGESRHKNRRHQQDKKARRLERVTIPKSSPGLSCSKKWCANPRQHDSTFCSHDCEVSYLKERAMRAYDDDNLPSKDRLTAGM